MKFADIAGHEEAKAALRLMADSGKVPSTMLLSGPSGIGKMQLARAFAQYLHCTRRHNGDSCGVCPSCVQHTKFTNADMHFIYPIVKKGKKATTLDYADKWTEFLGADPYCSPKLWSDMIEAGSSQPAIYVSQSEEILTLASVSTLNAERKIVLLWLPERMNVETANKLLKVLEEPYEDMVFLLVSNDERSLLPTIFSRTRRIKLSRLSDAEIADALRARGADAAQTARIVHLAQGNPAEAFSLLEHDDEREYFGSLYRDMMRSAYKRDVLALKAQADTIAGMGRERSRRFLDYAGRMTGENFIYNLGVPQLNRLTEPEEAFSSKFHPFVHGGNVEPMAKALSAAASDIERNANARIVMLDTLLTIMRWIRAPRQ